MGARVKEMEEKVKEMERAGLRGAVKQVEEKVRCMGGR